MLRYAKEVIDQVRGLRRLGKTYGEIRTEVGKKIPKSTLSEWCKNTSLPNNYQKRIESLNLVNLNKGRKIALEINKIKREEFFDKINKINLSVSRKVLESDTAKIALSMLCLGEASKYNRKTSRSFNLGSSDYRIIILFLKLLKLCFKDFKIEKIRCTVQCRADQDIPALESFWEEVTHVPKSLFYKSRIDPRTVGKPTQKKDYKGVLRMDYFDTKVQLELESLSNLVYNQISGPEV